MKDDVWPVSFGKDQKEYQVIAESIKIICVLCATDPEHIIDELTGYAWSESIYRWLFVMQWRSFIVNTFQIHR